MMDYWSNKRINIERAKEHLEFVEHRFQKEIEFSIENGHLWMFNIKSIQFVKQKALSAL